MHTQRAAFISAAIVSLAGLLTGCGGHAPSRASASTAAAATTASAAGPTTPDHEPFEVTKVSQSGELVWIHFNAELDPQSAARGVRVYEDVDTDPGGDFRGGSSTPWLDPSARVLLVRADSRAANEVRLQLTSEVRSRDGRALSGGRFSDALSFSDPGAEVVFEYRFRPGPEGIASTASQSLVANVSDDHGDEQSTATPLRQAEDGAIEVEADRDWFALDLLGGHSVTIRTETGGDTMLTLYDANNSPLATNDDDPDGGLHSVLAWDVVTSGRYYAEVRGFGSSTPTYRISLDGPGARQEAGDTPQAALVVQLGQSVSEALGSGDRDHFALDLNAGTPLRVEADHADVNLIALDVDGRAFAEPVHVVAAGETLGRIASQYGIDYAELARLNGIADPNQISVGQRIHVPSRDPLALDAPGGRLYVLAFGFEAATPGYTIGFRGAATVPPPPAPRQDDHGDDVASASSLTLGVDASGILEERGDVDWFGVDLREGKTYTLATVTAGDSILRVLDAGGVEQAKNDDDPAGGRHSALTFRAATSGRYYLEVSGYGQATFSFTLQAAERAPSALPNPARFRPRARTDVWHIDFRLRADLWAQDLASHGLSSGDETTDRLMRERVEDELLSFLSQKYKLSGDGSPIRGRSWKISFTPTKPSGRPGRNYSREVVGGSHEDGSRTLGVSYLDPGNRRREDNDDLGRLGIFSASIDGRNSTLRPALRASDRRFLDGSYLLGDGSSSDDSRFRRIRQVASDWAHALAVVTAHEAGHSVGLEHDESNPRGIMKAALSRTLLSDHATRFADPSALTLDANLGQD